MPLKTRLLIQSLLIFAGVVAFIIIGTYLFYSKDIRRLFYENLRDKAMIAAFYHLEKDELNAERFARIRERYRQIYGASIRFFNEQDKMVFEFDSLTYQIDAQRIKRIRETGQQYFAIGERQFAGIYYRDNQGNFVITASDINIEGEQQLSRLRFFLISFFLVGLAITYFLSRWLARQTFSPFDRLIHEVNQITTSRLNSRLHVPGSEGNELFLLTTTMNQLLHRIEAGVRSQQNFIKHASHELRTPLTSILGTLDVTLAKERDAESYRNQMQRAHRDAAQMMDILNGLLLISGLEEDQAQMPASAFRLDELILDLIEGHAVLSRSEHLVFELEAVDDPDRELIVQGNRELLSIALRNLIDNAFKYAEGKEVKITLKRINAGQLHLAVCDKGNGIAPEDLAHIFDLFFRGGQQYRHAGTGIGLYLSKRIAEKHGLDLKVESRLGEGACFYLVFPKTVN